MKFLKKNNYKVNSFQTLENLIRTCKNFEVQSLLQNVDSCHLFNKCGTTLLHVAVLRGNEVITQYILDKQLIDINAQDHDGRTPAMIPLEFCDKKYINVQYVGVFQVLLKSKPDLHIRDNFGKSTLQMVFEKSLDCIDIIQQFLNVIKVENENNSEAIAWQLISIGCPLRHAILFKNSEITRIMLEYGCPINDKDIVNGQTALHVAVKLKDLKNVQLLVEYGADVDSLDSQNRVPIFDFDYSGSDDELKMLKILLDRGSLLTTICDGGYCQITPVLYTADRQTLLMLLDSDIDLDARDEYALMQHIVFANKTMLRENEDIIEKLRTKNFNANVSAEGQSGLLFSAACEGLWQFVELLIDRGAESKNCSPLYIASTSRDHQSDYKKCVELLLENGEDPQAITSDGKTILDGMVSRGCYYATEAILGQLAIFEDYGFKISEAVRASIDSHQYFKNQFELCKQQLEELKVTVVHESMTLYKIYYEEQERIAFYARNDDFYCGLINFDNEYSTNSYYSHLLRRLLNKPIEYATLRRQTIEILCEITNLNYYSYHIIIDKIIGYIVRMINC